MRALALRVVPALQLLVCHLQPALGGDPGEFNQWANQFDALNSLDAFHREVSAQAQSQSSDIAVAAEGSVELPLGNSTALPEIAVEAPEQASVLDDSSGASDASAQKASDAAETSEEPLDPPVDSAGPASTIGSPDASEEHWVESSLDLSSAPEASGEPTLPSPQATPRPTLLLELHSRHKAKAGTAVSMETAAEARTELRAAVKEREYYAQQFAAELERSTELAQSLQKVKGQLAQQQSRRTGITGRLKNLQARMNSDRTDFWQQAAWLKQASLQKVQAAEHEVSVWKNMSAARLSQIQELQRKEHEAEIAKISLSRKVSDLQKRQEDFMSTTQSLDEESGEAKDALHSEEQKLKQNQDELSQEQRHSDALEAKLQLLQMGERDMNKQHTADQQDIARLRQQLRDAGSAGDLRMQSLVTRASQMTRNFQSSTKMWAEKNHALEKKLDDSSQHVEKLQQQLAQQKHQFNEAAQRKKQEDAELAQLRKQNKDMTLDADSREGLEATIHELQQKNSALMGALGKAQEDDEHTRQQMMRMQEQNLELSSRGAQSGQLQSRQLVSGQSGSAPEKSPSALALIDVMPHELHRRRGLVVEDLFSRSDVESDPIAPPEAKTVSLISSLETPRKPFLTAALEESATSQQAAPQNAETDNAGFAEDTWGESPSASDSPVSSESESHLQEVPATTAAIAPVAAPAAVGGGATSGDALSDVERLLR